MREIRTYGSEGGETGITGLPYPYHVGTVLALVAYGALRLPEP